MRNYLNTCLYPLLVFIIGLIFLAWGIGEYPLIDLDEPRYPEAAREMIENSQYWIPMTNGKLLFEKPILIYWSLILSFKTFGVTEFAARLPSVIAGALTLTSVFIFGRFFKIGIYASLILATCVEYFVIARLSIPELVLNFFTISSILIYFLISQRLISKNYFYLMSFLMAFGFMAKGPLAVFVPGLVVISYSLVQHLLKDESFQDKFKIVISNIRLIVFCSILFVIVGGTWFVIAHFMTDGGFTKQFFLTENLQRYTSTLTGHKFNWWFYLEVAFIGFLPWSIFLPAYFVRLKSNLSIDPSTYQLKIFSWIWIIANILFFTSSGTKLFNYVFSIFCPMAILIALWFIEQRDKREKDIFISSLVFFIVGLAILVLSWNGFFTELITKEAFLRTNISPSLVYVIASAVLMFSILGIVCAKLKILKIYFFAVALIFAAGQLYAVQKVIKPFAEFKVGGIKRFAEKIPKGIAVYRFKIDRQSLSFYYRGHTKAMGLKKLKIKLLQKEEFCVLAKKDKLDLFESISSMKVLSSDDSYVYACANMPEL